MSAPFNRLAMSLAAVSILACLQPTAHAEVVIEADDNTAVFSGSWASSTAVPGFYGSDFATATAGGATDIARLIGPRPVSTSGTYCVQARWLAGSNRSASARHELYDGTTLRQTVNVDQRANGGAWRTIACVALTAGRVPEVRVLDAGSATGTLVVADAVRWVWEESGALSLCIDLAGGASRGGGTYVAQGLALPANGTCKPWSGFMKTGSDVVGTTSGTACTSSDGRTMTASLATTNPSFFGPGSVVSDHIRLCPTGTCATGVSSAAVSSYFGQVPAARVTCTTSMLTLPATHN